MSENDYDRNRLISALVEHGPGLLALFFETAGLVTETRPPFLYHYTDLAGFKGIIERKEIWATNCNYLNDATEISHGKSMTLPLIRQEVEKFSGPQREYGDAILRMFETEWNNRLFAFCLCTKKDDISQWRQYGRNGRGIVIEFDTQRLVASLSSGVLFPVVYTDAEKRKAIAIASAKILELIRALDREEAHVGYKSFVLNLGYVAIVKTLWGAFKDGAFSGEHEWRVLETALVGDVRSLTPMLEAARLGLTPDVLQGAAHTFDSMRQSLPIEVGTYFGSAEQRYREKGGVLTPYVALSFSIDKSSPISRVIVGSNYGDEFSSRTIKDFLRANDWHDVEVETQNVPLRPS